MKDNLRLSMEEIDLKDIAEKYNSINTIWDESDKWHTVTHKMIKAFIVKNSKYIFQKNLLNAGSAGNNYGLNNSITHLDIAKKRIEGIPNSFCGSVEDMPFDKSTFEVVICVGSVINYCDPFKVISEFQRVLCINGILIVEFENSNTLELIGQRDFNKKVVLRESFYQKKKESVYYFSESYLMEIFMKFGFKVVDSQRCHIISPLVYRLTKNENFSSYFSILDKVVSWVPGLNKVSSNSIYLMRKTV